MTLTIPLTILSRGASFVSSHPRLWAVSVGAALALFGGAAQATQCYQQTGIAITPVSTSVPALSIYHLGDAPQLTVSTTQAISLSAIDYWGNPVTVSATTTPGTNGWSVTLPAQSEIGYFELTATASGGAVGCLQYAVVPSNAPDSRFGVVTQIGFGNPVGLEAAVAAAGIGAVKDSVSFQTAVPQVGGPVTAPAAFDSYMSMLQRDSITPLLVMAFANTLYEPSGSGSFTLPYGNVVNGVSDISGYAAYASGLAARYGNPGLGVSIWNEVDGSFCQGPACTTQVSRAAGYTTLTKSASSAVHKIKGMTVTGGATYGINLPWFESLFYTGANGGCPSVIPTSTPSTNQLLSSIDKLDVHWYSRPEDLDQALQDLTTLATKCGHNKPIVATEVGPGDYRNPSDGYATAVHQTPAEFVREAAVLIGRGVSQMYWYVLNDVTIFMTGDPEDMLQPQNSKNTAYVPNPVYPAYANLISKMAGMTAQTTSTGAMAGNVAPDNRSRIYAFKDHSTGTWVYIAWAVPEMFNADLTNADPTHVSFVAPGPTVISNVMGGQVASYAKGATVNLTLTASPVYVSVTAGTQATFTSTDAPLLASSADDFGTVYPSATPTTGLNGWSYGYIKAPTGGASSVALGFQAGFQPTSWVDGQWVHPNSNLYFNRTQQQPVVGYIGTTPMSTWAVRRWTCPGNGPACTVAITGQAQPTSALGIGVSVLVVANDTVQFEADLIPANGVAPGVSIGSPTNPGQPLVVTVQPGMPIDFDVTTGPGAITGNYDCTTLIVWLANGAPAQNSTKTTKAASKSS